MTRLVFSTLSYQYLGDALVSDLSADAGLIERKTFPDGERYQRLSTDVRARDVVLVGGTVSEADSLEVYDLASTIVKYGARSLTMIVPYFGYATMERATKSGEVVTAKTRARFLSSIPHGDVPNRILLLDVHTEGLPYYFEGPIVPVHVYGKPFVTDIVQKKRESYQQVVLACTDAGRAKWVESLANDLGLPASFVFKRRLDGSKTQVSAVSAQVAGKSVVIYDDMIRTGGSLIQAAQAYRDAGAVELSAVTTHGIFPGDALSKIEKSGFFTSIACTDSHPRARELQGTFLRVLSSSRLFADAIRAIDTAR